MTTASSFEPSAAQRAAVQAPDGPLLVLAGPGAGKTWCLIERIAYLIGVSGVDPARICALTFTNKAAEELATRLRKKLGEPADAVTRCTIHALCVKILRAKGSYLGLASGFGIADEEYQREILAKLRVKVSWRGSMLNRFGLHRLGTHPLQEEDLKTFERYRRHLAKRGMLDFDDLVHCTAELFRDFPDVAWAVASQWDYLLVDEFQDLNPVQYGLVRSLAGPHRNIFVVGDDDQSIFSWTGADPRLILGFLNDFGLTTKIVLDENRRTAQQIFSFARTLISSNVPLFETKQVFSRRHSDHEVLVLTFPDDSAEREWILADLERDHRQSGLPWGEYGVLYRKHLIGEAMEGALMQARTPCRLAQGRAMGDDKVVGYLIRALKVIAKPGNVIVNEMFVRQVLPPTLIDQVRKTAAATGLGLLPMLRKMSRDLPFADEDGKKMRRCLSAMQNLTALGQRHQSLVSLIDEILSQRVGTYRTILEERTEELRDPADFPEVVKLAAGLTRVQKTKGRVLLRPMGGLEIGLAGMLVGGGLRLTDYLGVGPAPTSDDFVLDSGSSGGLGLVLTTFKALQLVNAHGQDFRDFVVVDLETTDRIVESSEIVEIAAARVRNWEIVEEFHRLVKPRVPIAPQAEKTHGYSMEHLEQAPYFETVWPEFQAFVGSDVLVAHNGYQFDFPILARMSGHRDFVTYDTLPLARSLRVGSAKLEHLAHRFGVDPGDPHKALWDVRTLAAVYRKLEEEKVARARRVALSSVLDHLGIGLALSDPDTLDVEGHMLKEIAAAYSLGRFTSCLDFYRSERERAGESAASLETLIDRLGGRERMERIRTEKRPDQRYPQAMARVRRLLQGLEVGELSLQIEEFLTRVALSKSDGAEIDPARVNLLTLHSTKGLEFSRVYIVGVEDSEMPGGPSGRAPSHDELEESRRLLYVGMTRAKDRLVMTRAEVRNGRPTGGHRFFDEMRLSPTSAT